MALKVTYIGHATTLIEWNGINILTDPVFSKRVLCFKRLQPLNYDPATLPKLNAILISHAHYDHLDLFSYKYIPSDVPILVPEGMSKAIATFVNNPIIELATWARYSLSTNSGDRNVSSELCSREGEAPPAKPSEAALPAPIIDVCAVPAKHWGGRTPLSPIRFMQCHGYVVSNEGENLYFSGDTAYGDHFKNLSQLFKMKLALLPIAHNHSSWLFRKRHMNLEEVLQAWLDLGQPDWVPIHWGTFFSKYIGDPYCTINQLKLKSELNPALKEKLHVLNFAESLTL